MYDRVPITRWQKALVLLFWVLLIGSYEWYTIQRNVSHLQTLEHLLLWLESSYGVLVLLLLFGLRFVVLFPISLLVVLSGASFGFIPGVFLALVGVVLSGSTTYGLAYWLGKDMVVRLKTRRAEVGRWMQRLQTHGLETVLVLHLLFLPFDLVSGLAGCLHVRYRAFGLATLLGWIPGSIVFTMIGQTLDQQMTDASVLLVIQPWMMVLVVVMLGVSLLGAWLYRRAMV